MFGFIGSLIHTASVLFQEQKFLVGVILMVPCYAVESVRCYASALSFAQRINKYMYFHSNCRIRYSHPIIYCLTFYDFSCSTYHW